MIKKNGILENLNTTRMKAAELLFPKPQNKRQFCFSLWPPFFRYFFFYSL
ncbi:hypothetical protein CLOLEP_02433 [[Clostridium] leptum DSM 753]|uniref:Uncharacterized protein n=1 Tax=[Clostridium] leptum DSM 753 TaxID=428125 RepID=A7VV28_9FIRM|nr:hypothetical protein CLOLEP_02433 [[Clostridium] leptum DSM 753]